MRAKYFPLFLILIIINVSLNFSPEVKLFAKDSNHRGETAIVWSIFGVVVNENNQPVAGADVLVPELNIIVSTDPSGEFSFPVSSPGTIRVEASLDGFLSASTRPFILKDGFVPEKIRLVLRPVPVEELVVTGTATPRLYSDAPVKTSVKTREAIEKKGAATLADSLEMVTGVRVENDCQNCNFNQVRINGMEGKYSQILIDGMPSVSSLAGVYALEQIPANMIDRLEVVKGGGSSLYGGNAVAGVVNVITRRPRESVSSLSVNQGFINGNANSILGFNTDIISKNRATYASFFTNYQDRASMDYDHDGYTDMGELRNLSLGGNFNHEFSRMGGKLKLGFSSIFEDRRGGNKLDLPEHMSDIAESCRTYRADINAGWEQSFGTSAMLKLDAAWSHTKRKSYYGSGQDPNAYGQTQNPVFNVNLTYNHFSIKDHHVLAGVSFYSDSIRDIAVAYDRILDNTYTALGVFAQDEWELFGRRASLLAGVRIDKHSELDAVILSPRISFLYKGIEDITIRATFSTGYRAPQVFDEDLHITQVGGQGMLIHNRTDLHEERSVGFTLDVDFGRRIFDKKYQFSAGLFYNRLNGVFTLQETDATPNARVFERFNGKGASIYGVSLEAGFKWNEHIEAFTGWTVQKSRLDDPEPDFGARELFRSPSVYGSFRIDYTQPHWFDLSAELIYTGSMTVPHFAGYIPQDKLETTSPFLTANLTARKKINVSPGKGFTLSASVENLFDSFQQDLDQGMFRDSGYVYGPRFPRTVRVNIGYEF